MRARRSSEQRRFSRLLVESDRGIVCAQMSAFDDLEFPARVPVLSEVVRRTTFTRAVVPDILAELPRVKMIAQSLRSPADYSLATDL